MKPAYPGVKLTYDDYVQFPEDGKRHELIDGEHVVTPTPNRKHQAVSGNLLGLIWSHLQQHPVGRVYSAPFDVSASLKSKRRPGSRARRISWSRSVRRPRVNETRP